MNKTFKIVKNSLGQYVVAGEFAKSKSRSQTATKALLLSALSALSLSSYASIVRDDVDYQEFRNFAENKGKYQVGAVNIPVYDKSGKYLGTALPKDVPMPDFSVANSQTAVATLINSRTKRVINSSQYVGTVAHNTDEILNNLRFGDARAYHMVNAHRASDIWLDDNRDYDESIKAYQDFATPKLSKMVTSTIASEAIADKGLGRVIVGEVGSIDSRFLVNSSSTNADFERISDLNDIIYSSDYTAIARLGSGSQYMLDIKNDKSTEIEDAYAYVTGGSPMLPMGLSYDLVMANSPQAKNYLEAIGKVLPSLTLTREKGSPLISINLAGDSGSPLFTYNKSSQRWELFAFVQGGSACNGEQTYECYTSDETIGKNVTLFDKAYLYNFLKKDEMERVEFRMKENLIWEDKGEGISSFTQISDTGNQYERERLNIANYNLNKGEDKGAAALDHGRDLYLHDGANIQIKGAIDQGAGGIYLLDGEASVGGEYSHSSGQWVGSGVYVEEGAKLNWNIRQPQARELERTNNEESFDILSKLGKGTLYVTTKDHNDGEISVGEGEVILDKRAYGNYDYAFSKVELTSGRGRVTLNGENQVKNNTFSFGLRGGKLDLNGTNPELNGVYTQDNGANIVNHNTNKASNLILKPTAETSFFKGFLGKTEKDSLENGELNVEIQKQTDRNYIYDNDSEGLTNGLKVYGLSGGANLNGNLTATNNTTLYLQGYEIPYASGEFVDGKYEWRKYYSKGDSQYWENKDYKVKALNVDNNSQIYVGRNVANLTAETISVDKRSFLQLGFENGDGAYYLGSRDKLGDFYNSLPTTNVNVTNVSLNNDSILRVAKANLTGAINASPSSQVALIKDSTWNMNQNSYVPDLIQKSGSTLNVQQGTLTAKIRSDNPFYGYLHRYAESPVTNIGANAIWQLLGDSTVGNLNLEQGAKVLLNPENEFNLFNTLTIYDTLSGNGEFVFNTDLASLKGNKVEVSYIKGEHTIDVKDSGYEVNRAKPEELVLFQINAANQEGKLKLKNDHVDAGAFRYTLSDLVNFEFKLQDTTFKPNEPDPVTPVDPNPVTPVDPNPVTPVDPNPVTPVDPNPVTPVDPNPVTPVDPNPVTPVDPNPVTPVDPNPVTPVDPNPVTPVDPNPVTPVDPNPVTPVDPNPVTPVDPNPVTPVDPNPVNPVDPNPVTPVDLNPVTPVDPTPATPVDPNPVTPVDPNPVTPVDPNPVTPVDPNPVTPVDPNPVTPVDPNPVTPVDPNPVTPVDPNPVTPVDPNPVTPVDPNPVTPVDPNPVTPVDPNPVTPVDPNPVQPVQPTTPDPVKPQNEVISKYTNAVLSDAIAAEEAVLDAGSGMVQHIGNTTLSYDRQFNVWTGFSAQNADYSSSQYRDFKRQHRQTQLGVDMLAMPNVQMGLALTQAKNTNEFAEARGKNDLLMGNLYAKYLANNGAFIALDVGVGELKNEVTIAEKAKFTRNVVQVGVTAGKAFEFGQFEVKPQAGVRYSRLSSANYRLDGANINVEATKLTTAFVGVETGYKFNLGAMSVKPMISANYAVNKGEHTISVNGNNFTYDSDNQQNYRAGVEVKYRLATFSLNGGITKGNQLGTQRVVNAGLSFSF